MGATDTRLRAACDRCHTQKVRCLKEGDEVHCQRCAKAGAGCIFSPFRERKEGNDGAGKCGKRKRIEGTSTAGQIDDAITGGGTGFEWPLGQTMIQDDDQFAFDWSFGDCGNEGTLDLNIDTQSAVLSAAPANGDRIPWIPHPPPSTRYPGFSSTTTCPLPSLLHNPVSSTRSDDTPDAELRSTCIKELATLSIDLFEHQLTIPSQKIHEEIDDGRTGPNPGDYKVEDTLSLTQRVIDVYPVFMCAFMGVRSERTTPGLDWESSSPADSPPNFFAASLNDDLFPTTTQQTKIQSNIHPAKLDYPTTLLLLSLHLRLIAIYDELFLHMERCITQHGIPKNSQQARITAPPLKIGDWTPPKEMAVPMQMLLFVNLVGRLGGVCEGLVDAVKAGRGVASGIGGDGEEGGEGGDTGGDGRKGDGNVGIGEEELFWRAAERVRKGARGLGDRLSEVRREMLRVGIVA